MEQAFGSSDGFFLFSKKKKKKKRFSFLESLFILLMLTTASYQMALVAYTDDGKFVRMTEPSHASALPPRLNVAAEHENVHQETNDQVGLWFCVKSDTGEAIKLYCGDAPDDQDFDDDETTDEEEEENNDDEENDALKYRLLKGRVNNAKRFPCEGELSLTLEYIGNDDDDDDDDDEEGEEENLLFCLPREGYDLLQRVGFGDSQLMAMSSSSLASSQYVFHLDRCRTKGLSDRLVLHFDALRLVGVRLFVPLDELPERFVDDATRREAYAALETRKRSSSTSRRRVQFAEASLRTVRFYRPGEPAIHSRVDIDIVDQQPRQSILRQTRGQEKQEGNETKKARDEKKKNRQESRHVVDDDDDDNVPNRSTTAKRQRLDKAMTTTAKRQRKSSLTTSRSEGLQSPPRISPAFQRSATVPQTPPRTPPSVRRRPVTPPRTPPQTPPLIRRHGSASPKRQRIISLALAPPISPMLGRRLRIGLSRRALLAARK
jgi:hypothetical protein